MKRLTFSLLFFIFLTGCDPQGSDLEYSAAAVAAAVHPDTSITSVKPKINLIDSVSYRKRILKMCNGDSSGLWPAKEPLPLEGALIPFKRIVAFYGNYYSKQMGALGEYPKDVMLSKLREEVSRWEKADPETPVVPALHYIATTAQLAPGKDNTYRLRMPHREIDKTIEYAAGIGALVFIDIQVGHSTLQREVPEFLEYLKRPDFHLGIDPEFSMKDGSRPGAVIGSFDAEDINYVSDYLAKIVRENNLPPKLLVVHRFTRNMVTNYRNIRKHPEVQIIMDMDGWGPPKLKTDSYRSYIWQEPVQFAGIKLFYKNDIKAPPYAMMTPQQVMSLRPLPMYIQYQ
jgi:hypothetical protein